MTIKMHELYVHLHEIRGGTITITPGDNNIGRKHIPMTSEMNLLSEKPGSRRFLLTVPLEIAKLYGLFVEPVKPNDDVKESSLKTAAEVIKERSEYGVVAFRDSQGRLIDVVKYPWGSKPEVPKGTSVVESEASGPYNSSSADSIVRRIQTLSEWHVQKRDDSSSSSMHLPTGARPARDLTQQLSDILSEEFPESNTK